MVTAKQRLVIEDIAKKINDGKPMNAVESTERFYDVSSRASAKTISSRNFSSKEFRDALLEQLDKYGVVGKDSKISTKLAEGLEATSDKGDIDYNARLKYIQEINKIIGMYAPTQTEKKTMNLSLDMSKEELEERIEKLQKELE